MSEFETRAEAKASNKPQPKVIAATAGAGVAAAATTIGVWVFETTTHVDLPAIVEGSILTLVAAGVAFAAGYIKRN